MSIGLQLVKRLRCAFGLLTAGQLVLQASAVEFKITSLTSGGSFAWADAFTNGVVTVESANVVTGRYAARQNYFTSNSTGSARLGLSASNTFLRLKTVDLSTNTPWHFTNLLNSYGLLETIAGKGQSNADHVNFWQPAFEGGPATNANLSQPHITFADPGNNLLVVDESSHSVLKITTNGLIRTFAGTHIQGFNGDGTNYATNLHLNWPNGGWMRPDGTFYILDTYNNRVRRVDTNGLMSTLIVSTNASLPANTIVSGGVSGGRGLWVNSGETLAYFSSMNATRLSRWTSRDGVEVLTNVFQYLGNILGDERTGALYVTDRNANRVYRMSTNGSLTTLAGNGTTSDQPGGGEGGSALLTGLNHPRCICFLPNGGWFITEHYPGNRVWYVDPAGLIHLWLNGPSGMVNFPGTPGDGQWFYASHLTPRVYLPRAITTDRAGNLILTTSDYGFIRRIRFLPMTP